MDKVFNWFSCLWTGLLRAGFAEVQHLPKELRDVASVTISFAFVLLCVMLVQRLACSTCLRSCTQHQC